MLAAGKGGKTAVVIGVQTKGNDLRARSSLRKHAAKHGADAIFSLPPEGDNAAVLEYYKAIGKATDLPLFVQTIGATCRWTSWCRCFTRFRRCGW